MHVTAAKDRTVEGIRVTLLGRQRLLFPCGNERAEESEILRREIVLGGPGTDGIHLKQGLNRSVVWPDPRQTLSSLRHPTETLDSCAKPALSSASRCRPRRRRTRASRPGLRGMTSLSRSKEARRACLANPILRTRWTSTLLPFRAEMKEVSPCPDFQPSHPPPSIPDLTCLACSATISAFAHPVLSLSLSESSFHPSLGPTLIKLSSSQLTVGAPLDILLHLASPPPGLTIFAVKVYIVQSIDTTSTRDPTKTHQITRPKAYILELGAAGPYGATGSARRMRKEGQVLWENGPDGGGEWTLEKIARMVSPHQGRRCT